MNVASWSSNQTAVLTEIGVPLLRVRGAPQAAQNPALEAPVDSQTAVVIAGLGLSGEQASIRAIRASRWFSQLQRFLGDLDVELVAGEGPAYLHIPGQQPRVLPRDRPSADDKRSAYAAVLELRARQH